MFIKMKIIKYKSSCHALTGNSSIDVRIVIHVFTEKEKTVVNTVIHVLMEN